MKPSKNILREGWPKVGPKDIAKILKLYWRVGNDCSALDKSFFFLFVSFRYRASYSVGVREKKDNGSVFVDCSWRRKLDEGQGNGCW